MKTYSLLAALLVVFVVGGLAVFAATTPQDSVPADVALGNDAEPTPEVVVTVVPPSNNTPPASDDPEELPVEGALPPTPLPVPAAPQPAGQPAGTLIGSFDFDDGSLANWQFDQRLDDPVTAPDWSIADGLLAAPLNLYTVQSFNDPIALAPVQMEQDGTVAVTALTRSSEVGTLGVLVGYADRNNYAALLFSGEAANNTPGVALVQVVDGDPVVLANDTNVLPQPDTWYQLTVTRSGNTLQASIDGTQVASASLAAPLNGDGVGLRGDAFGTSRFDNLIITSN